ncbi:alpha-2-macroglobulin family protein [Desulfoluna spongiiphila]|uniref:Alpha-2-macroglobulin n=1 Tax=Desulfoluna spongiiphila TaxID=419481 RepID=A0A1G5I0F8_9BACT|nr:alpha-2-macroglobulin [Desulfoluna spongiiphila]SCY68778.1 hypothetical protein SAMN05216233_11686 [Desulfoluna spongiiphila]
MKRFVCLLFSLVMVLSASVSLAADRFRVLDIGEREYENGPALSVLFSDPLARDVLQGGFLRVTVGTGLADGGWVLSDDGRRLWFPHVEAETTYTVSVDEGLTSAAGKTLGEPVVRQVETRKVEPMVGFAGSGLVLPRGLTGGLPVATVNVQAVDLEFFRINEKGLRSFAQWRNPTDSMGLYQLEDMPQYGELVYSARFDLDPVKNRRVVRHIPIREIAALSETGLYFAVMKRPGTFAYAYQSTFFMVTDMGLSMRSYAKETVATASSLAYGTALSGIRVSFFDDKGRKLGEGRTDALGLYRTRDPRAKKTVLIRGESDNGDLAFLSTRAPRNDLSEFEVTGRKDSPVDVFVMAPRDLYRPSETVPLSFLVRDNDGKPVDVKNLFIRWVKPGGKVFGNVSLAPSGTSGYFQTTATLPGNAPTGRWRAEVRLRPGKGSPVSTFGFQVEEFLPERMAMDLSSDKAVLVKKMAHSLQVAGRYLYGAPAAGNRAEGRLTLRTRRACFPMALKDFSFGLEEDADFLSVSELGSLTLDASGNGAFAVDEEAGKSRSPLSVTSEVSLFESGGRPVTRRFSLLWLPDRRMPGIRYQGGQGGAGEIETHSLDLVVADTEGKPLAVKQLLLKVIRNDRNSYWEFTEGAGWQHRVTEKRYTFAESFIDLPAGILTHNLTLPSGEYTIEAVDPGTGLSTTLSLSSGHGYGGTDGAPHPARVNLLFDKKSYRAGDVARVKVVPPDEGEALVMVEGKTLLWARRTAVEREGTVVEIPVDESWSSHDIYVSVVVLRKTAPKEPETPLRAIGVLHLPLDRDPRALDVEVLVSRTWKEEAPLPVTVTVKKKGQAHYGRVWVAAVDVGILGITSFPTPDPYGWFFARRWYDVQSTDLFGKVIETDTALGAAIRFGGDGDISLGGGKPQAEVTLFSRVMGPFETDRSGKITTEIPLDDFSGTVRLMVVAFDDTSFGASEFETTVTPPLVVQLSAPRFLAPGDVSTLTADLTRMVDGEAEYTLTMEARGPVCIDTEPEEIRLSAGKREIRSWSVAAACDEALPPYGVGEVVMTVKGDGMVKRVSTQCPVRPGYPGEARETRLRLNPGESLTLDSRSMAELIPATVGGAVAVSTKLPLSSDAYVRDLLQYPYGCLEQVVSRAFPQLWLLPERAKAMGIEPLPLEKRREILDDAVARIVSMQRYTGGFGLWNAMGPEDPWLSCYAVDFLLSAREMGVRVPTDALRRGLERQRTWLVKGPTGELRNDRAASFAVRSYAAHNLSRVRKGQLATLRTLADNHLNDAADALAVARLALALKTSGDKRRSRIASEKALALRADAGLWRRDYGSNLRDLSMTVALFTEHKISVPAMADILDTLETDLRQRRWLSTQERFALFRLALAFAEHDDTVSLAVAEGPDTRDVKGKGPFAMNLTAKTLASGLSLTSRGKAPLFASAVVTGYAKTPPSPMDERIRVVREYFDFEGRSLDPEILPSGTLMLVNLRVTAAEAVPDALVVDLLPAGFEIENPNFEHSIRADETVVRGRAVWRHAEQSPLVHAEYREDRFAAAVYLHKDREFNLFYVVRAVSPGTFTVPPPFAESMYRPGIRGIGQGGRVIRVEK